MNQERINKIENAILHIEDAIYNLKKNAKVNKYLDDKLAVLIRVKNSLEAVSKEYKLECLITTGK